MVRMPSEVACSSIIDDLDDEQREAVLAARGPVCVLAGAGTGKTRTITRRIAHLVSSGHVAPGQVLAVTFTSRAAGEMRARLRALDDGVGTASVQAMTFHAAARRQLAYFWPRVVGNTGWELLDTKFAVVAQSANRAGLQASTDDVRDLAGEIEWAKGSLISPEAYPAAVASAGRDIPFDAAKVAAVYAGYETLKARRDGTTLLDFDDLLLHTAAAIENDAAVAQEFRDRYRCFVVDEYQDVTPLQQRVLDAWLGDRDDLTVVGDANQTIYSFTGATPQYLLDFSRRFPDAAVVRLERDYRSTPQVVSLANRVIAAARGRMAGSKLHLVGQRDPGPAPTFAEHPDEVAEAAAVAKNIKRLIEAGTAASEIAVLYRINAQSEVYEEALTEAGIPFQVRGGEGFFSRQEVRQSLVALQRAAERDIDGATARGRPRRTGTPGSDRRAACGYQGARTVGGTDRTRRTRRRGSRAAPVAGPACPARRASSARRRAASTGRPGRHARLSARRQGVGVGCGVPGRSRRRHTADLPRPDARSGQRARRRGTPPALRRNHQGENASGAQLGAGPGPGWAAEPEAVAVSQRRRAAGVRRQQPQPGPSTQGRHAAVSRVQRRADRPCRDRVASMRRVPVRYRREPARGTQGLAAAHAARR